MIVLYEGKEKNLLKHHPWVFSGAINLEKSEDVVTGINKVVSSDGRFVAWGYYDVSSHIQLRLVSWNEKETIDESWWRKTIRNSVLRRKNFFVPSSDTNVFRIIYGEADMLGGIAADVYGRIVRIIISARMAWEIKDILVSEIENLLHPDMIVLNTDVQFCGIESLHEVTEYYRNGAKFTPSESLEEIEIREDGLYYSLVPGSGQKSGFFCDQRENRKACEKYAEGKTVLDMCSYTGSFTLHALRGNAVHVDAFDASSDAVHKVVQNVKLNVEKGTLSEDCLSKFTSTKGDMFDTLRQIERNKYDMIILDPPKLAKTNKQLEDAKKGYKDINRLAMEKIKDGGILVTCSCSGALSREDFRTVLSWSAKDAGVEVQVLETLGQAQDHPIRLSFPESEYLKVFILRVIKQ